MTIQPSLNSWVNQPLPIFHSCRYITAFYGPLSLLITLNSTFASADMTQANYQLLHWVLKIGNLKDDIQRVFEPILGFHVLRHEEFSQGCEAQCNGPFSRPWSKTMLGYGEEERHFVLELAFNYGITSYKHGRDLRCILIHDPQGHVHQRAQSILSSDQYDAERRCIRSHDGYMFQLVSEAPASFPELPSTGRAGMLGVSLYVESLQRTSAYYRDILSMTVSPVYTLEDGKRAAYGTYSSPHHQDIGPMVVEWVELGEPIDHGKADGRMAIAVPTAEMDGIEERVRLNKDRVHTERVKLDTPGKATVEVVILLDRDGYEICIVGAEAFFELCRPIPGGNVIDWEQRIENGSKEQ